VLASSEVNPLANSGRKKNAKAGARRRQATRSAAARAKGSRNNAWYAVIAFVVIAGVVGVMVSSGSSGPEKPGPPPRGVLTFKNLERNHVDTPVHYPQTPPVGGNHAPIWQNCGFYSQPIASENGVHSMEHGAVWITYRPTLSSHDIGKLKDLTSQPYVLVSPWEKGLPSPVVASAWGKQLRLPNVSDPRLKQFVRAFRVGPQTPEPGAACTGGLGSPE
jgi:hypothetical protein